MADVSVSGAKVVVSPDDFGVVSVLAVVNVSGGGTVVAGVEMAEPVSESDVAAVFDTVGFAPLSEPTVPDDVSFSGTKVDVSPPDCPVVTVLAVVNVSDGGTVVSAEEMAELASDTDVAAVFDTVGFALLSKSMLV